MSAVIDENDPRTIFNACMFKHACQHRAEHFGPLLEAAEKSLRWLIGERDCYFDGCCTALGEVPEADDRETLAKYDRDIDDLQRLIKAARGVA